MVRMGATLLAVGTLLLALTVDTGALSTHGDSRLLAKPAAAGGTAGVPALRSSGSAAPHAPLVLRGGGPPLVPLAVAAGTMGGVAAVLRFNEQVRSAVMRWINKKLGIGKDSQTKKMDVRQGSWAGELKPDDAITSGYLSRMITPRKFPASQLEIAVTRRIQHGIQHTWHRNGIPGV